MLLDCGVCRVRPWRLGDAASLARHADDPRIAAQLRDRFPSPYPPEAAAAWVAFAARQEPAVNFAIEVAGEAAGGIGVEVGEDIERVCGEVGYWVGPAHWGRGVATAALRAFAAYALPTYGLTRLEARAFADNAASRRVLEKAGFAFEAVLRRCAIKGGRIIDMALYALVTEGGER